MPGRGQSSTPAAIMLFITTIIFITTLIPVITKKLKEFPSLEGPSLAGNKLAFCTHSGLDKKTFLDPWEGVEGSPCESLSPTSSGVRGTEGTPLY